MTDWPPRHRTESQTATMLPSSTHINTASEASATSWALWVTVAPGTLPASHRACSGRRVLTAAIVYPAAAIACARLEPSRPTPTTPTVAGTENSASGKSCQFVLIMPVIQFVGAGFKPALALGLWQGCQHHQTNSVVRIVSPIRSDTWLSTIRPYTRPDYASPGEVRVGLKPTPRGM